MIAERFLGYWAALVSGEREHFQTNLYAGSAGQNNAGDKERLSPVKRVRPAELVQNRKPRHCTECV